MKHAVAPLTMIPFATPNDHGEAEAPKVYRLRKCFAVVQFDTGLKGRIVFLPHGAEVCIVGSSCLPECFEGRMRTNCTISSKPTCWGPGQLRLSPGCLRPGEDGRSEPLWELALSPMAASIHSFARVPFPGEHRSMVIGGRPILAERRFKFRYPLELGVRFCSSSAGPSFSGAGVVVNLSSGGILVASEHEVTEGALVEMRIEWPSLLNGRVPLQLVAVGRILRRDASQFAATFERHQFRTMKSSSVTPD